MKRVIVVLSALFLLTLGTANAESAGRGRMGLGMMYDEPVSYSAVMASNPGLNLTAEQEARIQALDEKNAQEIKSLQARLHSKSDEMKSEWLRARPDRGKIIYLMDDVTKLRDQMEEKMINHRRAVLNLLIPEQRAQVRDSIPVRPGKVV